MQAANRVVLNTGFLYGKMLVTMLIALYATRLVLNGLGAVDYGIFNLVAGIVAMLSFLNSSMTLSTQRYMSFFLGSGDLLQLKKAFNSGIWLHLLISIIVVGLLELSGVYLFGHPGGQAGGGAHHLPLHDGQRVLHHRVRAVRRHDQHA